MPLSRMLWRDTSFLKDWNSSPSAEELIGQKHLHEFAASFSFLHTEGTSAIDVVLVLGCVWWHARALELSRFDMQRPSAAELPTDDVL